MSDISITISAGAEQVTARLTGWHGERLDASHLHRIHDTVDRALVALRVTSGPMTEPADAHARPR